MSKLSNTLQKLDFKCPYHQVIGFYLKYADYPANDWRVFAEFGTEFGGLTTKPRVHAHDKHMVNERKNLAEGVDRCAG